MKMYSESFVKAFAKKCSEEKVKDPGSIMRKFEYDFYKELPEDFEVSGLIKAVCEALDVSEDEYHSQYRYGNLSKSRQLVCYILKLYKLKSSEISQMTGFSQSRVINSIKAIRPSELEKINEITEKLGI